MARTHRKPPSLLAITLGICLGSLTQVGCQPASAPPAPPSPPAANTAPAPQADAKDNSKIAARETWEALFMQGERIGYSHTTVKPVKENGREIASITNEQSIMMKRAGEGVEMKLITRSWEGDTGELMRFTNEVLMGSTQQVTDGEVDADNHQLHLITKVNGSEMKSSIPWPEGCVGLFRGEESIRRSPMKVGEQRTFKTLMPMLNVVIEETLIARGKEATKLLGDISNELMRIDSVMSVPGGSDIVTTRWVDDRGETLKTRIEAMQQEGYRTTREVATAQSTAPAFDLNIATLVRIEPPLLNPHDTKHIRYAVKLDGADASKTFPSGPSQFVKANGADTAEITVTAVRPDQPATLQGTSAPVDADLSPNSMIQSDDPKIIQLAENAAPESATPWEVALTLEKLVHNFVSKKNFSQVFSTATDVLESRSGDCTEHAVLLAALLRARKIPARLAMGMVYSDQLQAFGGHMWTEAWIGDRWIPLDATLGKGGIGGAHLKIADTNFEGSSAFASFLPVLQLMGKLKITVLEQE